MNLDVEVVAEDEQLFLGRMQQILLATDSSSPLSSCSTDSPLKRTSLGKGTPRSPAGMHGSAKKVLLILLKFKLYFSLFFSWMAQRL